MTDPNTPDQPPRENTTPAPPAIAPPTIEPAAGAPASVQADELLAHGLLAYLNTDTREVQSARVLRVMDAIHAERAPVAAGVPDAPAPYRFRLPIRSVRGWVALAASISLVTMAVFFGFPGETSAQAVVSKSIEAMRAGIGGGDRRYEVRLTVRGDSNTERTLDPAIVDMRSPNLLLLRVRSPEGDNIVAGRDATGDWCIRLARDGGGIEREHPQVAWPRWSKVGDESLFADSVDRLLEEMTHGYVLSREPDATIDGGTKSFRHIVATKKRVRAPGGDIVEIWIDPDTNAVERMVMKWNEQPGDRAGDGQPAQGRPNGPGGAGPDDQRPMDRPMRPRGPREGVDGGGGRDGDGPFPPRRPRMGPPEGDADGGGPDRGPDGGQRPEGPDAGPDAGPDGGPRDGGPDGPPNGDRPFRGPRRGPAGEGPEGPRGIPGLGPLPPGVANGQRQQSGPQAMGPGRNPGDRHGPPKMIVIQRVDAPAFEQSWFSPEAHVTK